MASLLERVGKGLVSFGTGIPQVELDRANLENKNISLANQAAEQQIEQRDTEAQRLAERQRLTSIAFGTGPEADQALQQLFALDPSLGDQVFESIGARTQFQREDAARRAAEIHALPPEQRAAAIQQQVAEGKAQGRDMSDTESLLQMSPQQQDIALRTTQAAALSARERLALQGGQQNPAEQRAFEALIEGFSPEDQEKARRIQAGLDPRAGSSSTERIAQSPELTELVAASQADIREAGKFAEATGSDRAKRIDAGFDTIQKIDANIRNLDNAIAALDDGAASGAVVNRFSPTVRESTVALKQVQAQLGLDVVQAVQFGALSEGELQLALATALPDDLPPAALREWIVGRQNAQRKLRDYYRQQIDFLDQGGTAAGFLRQQERQAQPQEEAPQTTNGVDPALLEFMTPEERALFE